MRLSDVTQHINRKHQAPIHCPRCSQCFENGGGLERHIVQGCQVKHFSPYRGATHDQMITIKKVNPESDVPEAANKDERRWYGRFATLFGHDATRPPSPYRSVLKDDIAQKTQSYIDEGHLDRFAREWRPNDKTLPHLLQKLLGDFAEKCSPDSSRPEPRVVTNTPSTSSFERPAGPAPPSDPTPGQAHYLPTSPSHNTLSLIGPFPSDGNVYQCDNYLFEDPWPGFSATTRQEPRT